MKKIKNKSGFTLVECIVAMAVLVIMSLLLMMILTASITARNNNRQLESDLDGQVNQLMADVGVTKEAFEQTIQFEVVIPGEANYVETIPAAGTDAVGVDHGIDADRIYALNNDAEVDILKYDFDDYKHFKDLENGIIPGNPGNPSVGKAYGGAKINGNIEINQTAKTDIMEGSDVVGYSVTLNISCNVTECSKTAGIKLVLPSGVYNVKKGSCTNVTTLALVSSDTIRIQPALGTDENQAPGNISAEVKFDISKSDYENRFKSVGEFYGSSNISSTHASQAYTQPEELLEVVTAVPGDGGDGGDDGGDGGDDGGDNSGDNGDNGGE